MQEQSRLPTELEELTLALLHSRSEVTRLRDREQLISSLLGSINAVLWAFDWDTQKVIYVSPAYETVFGRPASSLMADYGEWRNSIYPDDVEYAATTLAKVLETGSVESREYRIIRSDGQLRWLSDKCFMGRISQTGDAKIVVGIAEDITDKKQLEGELQRLATTDVLTESSNRRHFFECAQHEFEHARKQGSPLAFLLLDIDDFKQINDRYGHQMGDEVLRRMAASGASVLRRGDLFGRVGGEEFAALLPGCEPALAAQIAERLQRVIKQLLFSHENKQFGITVSQGLTCLANNDLTVDALFARADEAMYKAKRQGKNQVVVG